MRSQTMPTQWARKDMMSRGENCRETSFVSQLFRNDPHSGVNLERGKKPSLVGEGQFGRDFRRQFG